MRESESSRPSSLRSLRSSLLTRFGAPNARSAAAAAALALSLYVGLALAYRDAIPLFEAPDEPSHLHYATFILSRGRLPRQDPLDVPGEGMQPPLVYLIAAPLIGATPIDSARVERELRHLRSPNYPSESYADLEPIAGVPSVTLDPRGHGHRFFFADDSVAPLRIARFVSLAFGLLAVVLTFAAAWRLSRDAGLSLLAASLLAFNPQFLFCSGYFSNDPAAAAIGAAALYTVACALANPRGGPSRTHYAAGAVVAALGVLTKSSTLPALAVAGVTLVTVDRRGARAKLLDLAWAAAIVSLLAGPYLIWAAEHRGGLFGTSAVLASASAMQSVEDLGGRTSYLATLYWYHTFASYWARFGWFNVVAPAWIHFSLFALAGAGMLGFIARHNPRSVGALRSRALRGYLIASVLATLASHFALNLVVVTPQGRQLFASAPQFALLLALGLYPLVGSTRRRLTLALAVIALLIAIDAYCLRGVLVPAYQ